MTIFSLDMAGSGIDGRILPDLAYGRNANVPTHPAMSRRIAFVIFPDFQLLDATGPIAAFEIAGRYRPGAYNPEILAPRGGPVASTSGAALVAEPLKEGPFDTIVVAGGEGSRGHPAVGAVVDWLRREGPAARRIA